MGESKCKFFLVPLLWSVSASPRPRVISFPTSLTSLTSLISPSSLSRVGR
ncbi:MAG: hypothetical protein SWY16_18465 [Cyanobacteriota bacterium]|nr:hypothetical protein [Cyanobacteriota bacterium]